MIMMTKEEKLECIDYIINTFTINTNYTFICSVFNIYIATVYNIPSSQLVMIQKFPELENLIIKVGKELNNTSIEYTWGDAWQVFPDGDIRWESNLSNDFKIEKLAGLRKQIENENTTYRNALTVDYQFGYYLGNDIVHRFLPTTSVDMISTKKRISTTYGEFKQHKKLDDIWFDNPTKENWKAVNDYWKLLTKKYLPETLICTFTLLKIDNESEFKNGIINRLWQSDVCHYSLKPEEIIIKDTEDAYFTEIIFKLDVNK